MRVVRRRAVADRLPLAAAALLLTVSATLAVALPQQLASTESAAFRDTWRDVGPIAGSIEISADGVPFRSGLPGTTSDLVDTGRTLAAAVPRQLAHVLGPPAAQASAGTYVILPRAAEPQLVSVDVDPAIRPVVQVVERARGPRTAAVVDVMVSRTVAEQLGLAAGDVHRLEPTGDSRSFTVQDLRVRVRQVVEPLEPSDPRWVDGQRFLQANTKVVGLSQTLEAAVIALPADVPRLARTAGWFSYQWRLPLQPAELEVSRAATLADAVRQYQLRPPTLGAPGQPVQPYVTSGITDAITDYLTQRQATRSFVTIGLACLVTVSVLTLGLAARLLVDARRDHIRLLRARGAGLGQLLGAATAEALPLAGICAGAGAVVGLWLAGASGDSVTRTGPVSLAVLLAAAFVVVTLALVVVACRSDTRSGRQRSTAPRWRSARRITAELALVGLAVAAVVLLRRRGLSQGATTDPLLAAAPVLCAVAVAVLVLRLLPLVGWLGMAVTRQRGIVGLVGLGRAAREPTAQAGVLLVLLVALSTAVFGGTVRHTLREAQAAEAFDVVGADARIGPASAPLPADIATRAAQLPGVSAVATLAEEDTNTAFASEGDVLAVAADTQALAAVWQDTPAEAWVGRLSGLGEGASHRLLRGLLVLPEDNSARPGDELSVPIRGPRVSIAPRVAFGVVPGIQWNGPVLILDTAALGTALDGTQLAPTRVLIRGAAESDALAALAKGSGAGAGAGAQPTPVYEREEWLADVRAQPFVGATTRTLGIAAAAAWGLAVAGLVLGLAVSTRRRLTTLARLRTLGLAARQSVGTMAVELAPMTLLAALAGSSLGLGLADLIVPEIELAPYAGGDKQPPVLVDVLTTAGLAGSLICLVGVAVLLAGVAVRRLDLARHLRSAEER